MYFHWYDSWCSLCVHTQSLMAGAGGAEGYALKPGQIIPVADAVVPEIQVARLDCRPPIVDESIWHIDLVIRPNDDWIDDAGHETFFNSDWKLQARSNRTGLRLEGPEPSFSDRATNRLPEHGEDPPNILDHGHPMGAINLAGPHHPGQ